MSRNAALFGIYSTGDVVRPEEEPIYHLFCEGFQQDLAPEGAMETTLAAEIVHAAWRLRRCTEAESAIEIQSDAQNSIDRARTQALRHFQRATAELRRIQTERQIRNETVPEDFDASTLGLASCKDMAPILKSDVRRQLLLHKLKDAEMSTAVAEAICAPLPAATQTIPVAAESAPIRAARRVPAVPEPNTNAVAARTLPPSSPLRHNVTPAVLPPVYLPKPRKGLATPKRVAASIHRYLPRKYFSGCSTKADLSRRKVFGEQALPFFDIFE